MDQVTESKVIGVATPRIDGPLKVSGAAMYASDHNFPGLLYAWPVCATISNGTITRLDPAGALRGAGAADALANAHGARLAPARGDRGAPVARRVTRLNGVARALLRSRDPTRSRPRPA